MERGSGSFLKYSASSVICFLLDYGLFTLLNAVLLRGMADGARELAATYGARIVSAVVNYLLNRNVVFGSKGKAGRAFIRYVILAVIIMLLSASGTWLLGLTGMSSTIAKLIVDTLLYFVSYRVQQQWVFKEEA